MTKLGRASRSMSERASGDEAVLVKAAAAGDARAFIELARRHQDALYAFCLRLVGDTAVAEDVAAATFVEAWRALLAGEFPEPVAVSLLSLAIPKCRGVRVYRMRRPPGRKEAMGGGKALAVVEAPQDDAARLARDLGSLDEEHRAALLLRDLYQLDDQTIGYLLGVNPDLARSRVHRARAVLSATTRPDDSEAE